MIARPGRERRLRSLLRTSPVVAILGARQSGKTSLARSLQRRAALLDLDLLVVRGGTRLGFEMKRTVAPQLTRSMHVALGDLGLARLDVVHAGD